MRKTRVKNTDLVLTVKTEAPVWVPTIHAMDLCWCRGWLSPRVKKMQQKYQLGRAYERIVTSRKRKVSDVVHLLSAAPAFFYIYLFRFPRISEAIWPSPSISICITDTCVHKPLCKWNFDSAYSVCVSAVREDDEITKAVADFIHQIELIRRDQQRLGIST